MRQVEEIALLREEIEAIAAIERPSASEGERRAAEWVDNRFRELGLRSRIEVEEAHGTYWLPLGLASAVATIGGMAALRGRRGRILGTILGAAAAAGIWDDTIANKRVIRRPLPKRPTYNVVAELGPADAEKTVVLIGHHDAAHSGLIFNPRIPEAINRYWPKIIDAVDTSPPIMWLVAGGPAAVALGSLLGMRRLTKVGVLVSIETQLAMLDIAMRKVVPGANDNASGVATLFGVARALKDNLPDNVRVIFLSAGSEESFEEGSQAFAKRHFSGLPKESTFFICVDGVGSQHLLCLEGEGMMKMYEYPQDAKDLANSVGEELGLDLWKNMRLRNSTDGLIPLRAGYKTVSIVSCTALKQPINYHWPTDTPDCVSYESVGDAVRLATGIVRRLSESWLS